MRYIAGVIIAVVSAAGLAGCVVMPGERDGRAAVYYPQPPGVIVVDNHLRRPIHEPAARQEHHADQDRQRHAGRDEAHRRNDRAGDEQRGSRNVGRDADRNRSHERPASPVTRERRSPGQRRQANHNGTSQDRRDESSSHQTGE